MGLPYSGPQTSAAGCCNPPPGTYPPPDIAPYVVSLNDLSGILTIDGTGGIEVTNSGGTIYLSFSASAGLGTVTSVGLSSTSLTVGGSPITTFGTLTVNLTGATASIQNLVTAADKMIYTTASNVYATTDLTAFARTLLDDAAAVNARSTLGLVIGTDVQAYSSELTWFINNTSQVGVNITFAGDLTLTGPGSFFADGATITDISCDNLTASGDLTITGNTTSAQFIGGGASLTGLNGSAIASGTVAVARGGTGLNLYAVGDIPYASGTTTLSKLADVAAGSYLRSGGVNTAPVWSSITLPNALTAGDLLYASNTVAVNRLADVATGNALISGGVGVAPSWGKITASHTTGLAASGSNGDITTLSAVTIISSNVSFTNEAVFLGAVADSTASDGTSGQVLTTTGSAVLWSNQLSLDTVSIATTLSVTGTITGSGQTGNKTINKPCGTVRIAAAGSSVVVTNSLCLTTSRVLACCATNDTTAYVKNVVTTNGAFTITTNTCNAETEIFWQLINIV